MEIGQLLERMQIITSNGAEGYDESIEDPLFVEYVAERQQNVEHSASQQPYAAQAMADKVEFAEYVDFPAITPEHYPLDPLVEIPNLPPEGQEMLDKEPGSEISQPTSSIAHELAGEHVETADQKWETLAEASEESDELSQSSNSPDQYFLDAYSNNANLVNDVTLLGRALRMNTALAEDVYDEFVLDADE